MRLGGRGVELSGGDVTLSAAGGTIRLNVTPASAQVTIKGPNDAAPRPVTGTTLQLSEGTYQITARAPNHADRTHTVIVATGDNKTIDIPQTEQKQQVAQKQQTAPQRRTGGMADFDDPGTWIPEGGWYKRKGGGEDVEEDLTADSIRGTSGLVGGVRFAIIAQPQDGAVRVVLAKSNYGPRTTINLRKGDHGVIWGRAT